MTRQNEEVIDLTNSFTLVDHQNMKGVIIVLESDNSSEAQTETEYSTSTHTQSETQTRSNSSAIHTPSTGVAIYDLCTPPAKKIKKKSKSSTVAEKQTTSTPANKKQNRDTDLKNFCPICFEPHGTNPLASTKCGHVFCDQCIKMALKAEAKCPTCRRKLKGKNVVHPIFL